MNYFKKIDRRKFIGAGIAGGMGILILPGIGCTANNEKSVTSGVMDEAEGLTPDWLRYPRFFTVDCRPFRSGLERNVIPVSEGAIAKLVKKIADNGGTVFRFGIYHSGMAFYQSTLATHAPELEQLDYLKEAVEQGKKSGVKIVAYLNPNSIWEDHPLFELLAEKWGVRDYDGEIWWDRKSDELVGSRLRTYPCINNPGYRDYLLGMLKEIFSGYGADGFYIDQLTSHTCFCEHCRAKYRTLYSSDFPEKFNGIRQYQGLWEMTSHPVLIGTPGDPDFERYTEFQYQNITDIYRDFSVTAKSCKPGAAAMFHTWPKPNTIQYYDGTLGEIYISDPWIHILWKIGEMTNYGSVFPGLLVLQNLYLTVSGTTRESEAIAKINTPEESRHKAYQILANGMLPNFWYFLEMKTVFDFLRENEKYYDYVTTRPVKFLAFVRDIRNDEVQRKIERDYPVSGLRDRFLAPYVGFYSAMMRSGMPVVTIHRFDFHEKMSGFKVLCLVNEAGMTDQQADAVRKFVADGGGLIATGETSLYDEKAQRRADFALKDLFGASFVDTLSAGEMAVEFDSSGKVTKGLENPQLVYDEPIVVVNPLEGKVAGWIVDKNKRIPAVITNTYGKGRVVYIPARFDSLQCEKLSPAIEKLFANSVNWVTQGEVPVQINAQAVVGVTLFDQPDRRMLHLLNYNAGTMQDYQPVKPVSDIKIKMSVPEGKKVSGLHLLMKRSELQYNDNGGLKEFTMPELGEYEVVVMEFE